MLELTAVGIIGIFAVMFVGIVAIVMWFTHASSRDQSRRELKKKEMDIIDKHFDKMVRIECPYCKTIYSSDKSECPTCGAESKKILFPEING